MGALLMPKRSKVGDTNVSANGYSYTKTEDGWRLTHHLIAEQKLGRRLRDGERVYFRDNDRTNLDVDNVEVREAKVTIDEKIILLKEKIARLQTELEELEAKASKRASV